MSHDQRVHAPRGETEAVACPQQASSGRSAARAAQQRMVIQRRQPWFRTMGGSLLLCVGIVLGAAGCATSEHRLVSAPGSSPTSVDPPHDIPRLHGIAIDGDAGAWSGDGFRIDAFTSVPAGVRPRADFDAQVRLGWDDRGLLVLAHVHDDSPAESDARERLFAGDSVELFIEAKPHSQDVYQPVMAPGRDAHHPQLRWHIHDYRVTPALRASPATISAARRLNHGDYDIEALLPWSNLGLSPVMGMEIGFNVIVNDLDRTGNRVRMMWCAEGAPRARLRLAQLPGQPATVAASAAFRPWTAVLVNVVAQAAQAGEAVKVTADGHTLAHGTLAASDGRAVRALLKVCQCRNLGTATRAAKCWSRADRRRPWRYPTPTRSASPPMSAYR